MLETQDLIIANNQLVAIHKLEIIKTIIWDASEIDGSNVDEIEVEISTEFSVSVNLYNPHIKVAFLARDKHLRDLIRQTIELTQQQLPDAQQKLFDNINDARTWTSC